MLSEQTEKRPFKSLFGGGFISANQYLAEAMCLRIARSKKKELCHRFWQQPEWARQFAMQARHAASLLKLYDIAAITLALRTRDGKKIYSLGAPWLDPLIKSEQERLNRQVVAEVQQEPASSVLESQPPRPLFIEKPSLASKLRGL